MKKKLTTAGNTWQLYINKPIAQLLGINKTDYNVILKIEDKILYVNKVVTEELPKYSDLLVKKLIKRSSGFGLSLSIPILELLEVNPENDFLDINLIEKTLIIKKSS